MQLEEIRKNAPSGATHYKKYENYENLVAYYRVSFIEFDEHPSIKEQYLWYHEKWVYCTPLSGEQPL